MISNLRGLYRKSIRLISYDIWDHYLLQDRSLKGHLYAILRVASITYNGMVKNNLFSKAASLSYSSLLALGPLLVVAVLVSGAFFKDDQEEYIKRVLLFIAPTLEQYQAVEGTPPPDDISAEEEAMSDAVDDLISQITEGAQKMAGSINRSGGGIAGIVGLATIIFIGIQLITSIETTFNQIWGANRGRSWWLRIVLYWTFMSMGTLLGLGAFTLFSATTIVGYFNFLPFGESLTQLFVVGSPVLSFLMLVILLTVFYQFFPNVKVRIGVAFTGALLVAAGLVINNLASILYINIVIRTQSIYGSVAIVPVLMVGLYFFWVFILVGGQITFALQNANFLVHQQMWNNISLKTRETLTLSTLLLICRNFARCQPPITATALGSKLRVPGNVLNESLSRLEDMHLIQSIPVREGDNADDLSYVPGKPLGKMSLNSIMEAYAGYGNSEGTEILRKVDPLTSRFRELLDAPNAERAAQESLETLLEETEEDR